VRGLLTTPLTALGLAFARASTVCTYAAAGTLTLDGLRRQAQRDWRDFGVTQTEQDIAAGLFAWEKDFYLPFLKPSDTILVVGCGSGRDVLALLEMGHRVDGLDPVVQCLALAEQRLAARGLRATLIAGPVETTRIPSRYDIAIFSWFCYSYIPVRARRVAALARMKACLEPGGRIVISYLRAEPLPRRALWRLARLTAALTRSDWRPEYGDVFTARHDNHCLHFEHRFRADEIEAEAAAAGLAVVFHDRAGDNIVLGSP
jgi:SAM-dependent methyltransferase